MAFTTENRTIKNIFERGAVYVVPRYQRGYVWKEVNWKELWFDLQFTVENSNIPWSHFLGTFVLNETKKKDNGLDIYEIIDGQQRMMTIYLLLIAIYKNFKIIDCPGNTSRSEYIYESFLTSLTKESEKRLMIDNDLYNKDLGYIVDAVVQDSDVKKDNSLYLPFKYFDNKLGKKDFDYLDKFLEKLLSVNVVEIISGEDEEVYNIFEVLNARGQKLKQIELLKNHIMKYIKPREAKFIDETKEKWQGILYNVGHLRDPDVLIQHFAKCYIEKNADNKTLTYRLIKEEVGIGELNKFLLELEVFSKIYGRISKDDLSDEVIRYFNIKGNQQIRSLLCAIFVLHDRNIINEDVKKKALKQILNFFFIFNVTQQTSNRIEKIISGISYGLYHCKSENQFKMLFSEFMYTLKDFISNKNYKAMFESNPSFKYSNKEKTLKRNAKLVRYVLEHICAINQNDTQIISENLTIEHLASDDGTLEKSSIWNLTLTSEEINSVFLGNKEICDKVRILKEKSTIRENQNMHQYMLKDGFDFNKRKNDMLNKIFDEIFVFNPQIFYITKQEVDEYNSNKSVIISQNDAELLNILESEGKNFNNKIEHDPKLQSLYVKWKSYKSGANNSTKNN
ncbi:MAG: hypothetical protein BWX78_01131 [Firmicutes bacterium ADurb.Bin099]|nr:MAG: hypothetical protein BWX78_01131 [Firmicutes bacterium ADurb.Bin099]